MPTYCPVMSNQSYSFAAVNDENLIAPHIPSTSASSDATSLTKPSVKPLRIARIRRTMIMRSIQFMVQVMIFVKIGKSRRKLKRFEEGLVKFVYYYKLFIPMYMRLYNPEVFQGNLRKKHYFEGWYYKHVSQGLSCTFSFIPGISVLTK